MKNLSRNIKENNQIGDPLDILLTRGLIPEILRAKSERRSFGKPYVGLWKDAFQFRKIIANV